MKKALLICPEKRPGLDGMTEGAPLVLAVYLGKALLEHALDGFARDGVESVTLLVSDQPAEVRDFVGGGSTWGISVEVMSKPHEFSLEEARDLKVAPDDQVFLLEALPRFPSVPILRDAESWHHSRCELLTRLVPGQIGAREISPGIWTGLKAKVAPTATLEAPCWIGHGVRVNAHAVIGPGGFVENDSLVDNHAAVSSSTIGACTYLGSMTQLENSVAAGSLLMNWRNGSRTRLQDAFLLSRLAPASESAAPLPGRLLALVVLFVTLPVVFLAPLLALLRKRPWCGSHLAALPTNPGEPHRQIAYHDLPSLPGLWSRWPWLWRIVTGHFGWTGNPPLSPDEAQSLTTDFERLWLQVPPAPFTAPEAEGCCPPWDDEARAHAALFAGRPTRSWRLRILTFGLRSLLRPSAFRNRHQPHDPQ